MKYSQYNHIVAYKGEYLFFNTRSMALTTLQEEQVNLISSSPDSLPHELYKHLVKGGYIISEDTDELAIIRHNLYRARYCTDELSLTILPTSTCNFRCIYCFEGEKPASGIMSTTTINAIVEYVKSKISRCNKLSVCWYGGEPLLAFDVIKQLSELLILMCEERKIKYNASIVTNGYLLTKSIANQMEKLRINDVQITLDGTCNVHDNRRALLGGGKTYKTIIANIKTLSSICNTVRISIRINVDKTNQYNVESLLLELKELHIPLNISLGQVEAIGDYYDFGLCLSCREFTQFQYIVKDMLVKYNLWAEKEVTLPVRRANYCCSDHFYSSIIDEQGNLYKCWADIGDPGKSIGSILAKSLENTRHYLKFIDYDATRDKECAECSFLPLCMGGCPNKRINNYERCDSIKYSLEKILIEFADHNAHK